MTSRPRPPRSALEAAGIFAVSAAALAFAEGQRAFRDPDAFYHAKMAQMFLRGGIVREFPWLPFTTFGSPFADQHFLYHAVLVPFVAAYGPFLGLKVATVLLGALAAALFYAMLRELGARWPAFFALVFATSTGYVYRAGLGKVNVLSSAVLFLAVILLSRGRRRALAVLSFLYVWTYGGWPLLVIVVGAWLLASSWSRGWRGPTRDALMLGAWSAAGLAAGLVVNPYFPSNIAFLGEQFVQIGVVGYRSVIEVGAEWYAPTVGQLWNNAGIAFILFAVGIGGLAAFARHAPPADVRERAASRFAGTLAAVFFALLLRNARHLEYFFPFAIAFDALLVSRASRTAAASKAWDACGRAGRTTLFALLILFLVINGIRDVRGTRAAYDRGWPWTRYERVGAWLRANVPPGEVLFHSDWEDFPMLWTQDDRIRYVAGLDPTFFYRKDPAKYREWKSVVDGTAGDAAADVRDLGARYVLVRADRDAMRRAVEADGRFRLDYADDEARVYELAR